MHQVERATFEVLAGDVFESLPTRPEIDAVANLGVAGHGSDALVLKVLNEFGDGVGGDDRVGIDTNIDLLMNSFEGKVESRGLAAVGLDEHFDATGGDLRFVSLARDLSGAVGGAIVDDEDVDVFVIGVQHRADGAHDNRFFLVGRNQHGDARVVTRRSLMTPLAEAIDDSQHTH